MIIDDNKYREYAKRLVPIDDILFRKMAEEKAFCEEILRVILSDKRLIVTKSTPQWDGKNLLGRSVILDCKCITSDNRTLNVEVQKENDDDFQRRARYNGAILTTNITKAGLNFRNIPDVCVIFIAKFDMFKKNLPIYHVERIVKETGEVVDNGFSEIYVNATARDGSEISELMQVFTEQGKYNDKFPITSKIKHRFTETEKGVTTMSDIVKEIREEDRQIMFQLGTYLMKNNRFDDWKKASEDKEYFEKLIDEMMEHELTFTK